MRLGIVGAGNMASAILDGILASGLLQESKIIMSDVSEECLSRKKEKGITVTTDNLELVKNSDVILFAVKPNVLPGVLSAVKEAVSDKLLISIAAGVSIQKIKAIVGQNAHVIRTMPNTPLMVGEGMTVLCTEAPTTDQEMDQAQALFDCSGETARIPEKWMDIAVAVNGSSPAYVFMMIEAMADAAVQGGVPRNMAYTLSAQSVLGSAKMVLDTGKHPGVLKDMVCSPGGTTIDAVASLEQDGFRSALMRAMEKCAEKSRKLGE